MWESYGCCFCIYLEVLLLLLLTDRGVYDKTFLLLFWWLLLLRLGVVGIISMLCCCCCCCCCWCCCFLLSIVPKELASDPLPLLNDFQNFILVNVIAVRLNLFEIREPLVSLLWFYILWKMGFTQSILYFNTLFLLAAQFEYLPKLFFGFSITFHFIQFHFLFLFA